jgi:hypothetical protein
MAMNNKTLRPRVSGFNPKSISGLYAWYDASDASTITQATGVSAWADKSGNGRTCSQATGANQPAYVLAGQNGKNVIDFSDATKNMTTNGTAWSLTDNTMFWSFQFPDTAASAASWVLFDFNTVRELVYGNTTSEFRIGVTVTGIVPVSRRWYILSVQWLGIPTIYRLNQSTGTTLTANATYASGASSQMYMGFGGGATGIRGYIGECITYSTALSATQVTTVNNYLAKKWGATIV